MGAKQQNFEDFFYKLSNNSLIMAVGYKQVIKRCEKIFNVFLKIKFKNIKKEEVSSLLLPFYFMKIMSKRTTESQLSKITSTHPLKHMNVLCNHQKWPYQ